MHTDRFLKPREVSQLTSLHRATIHRKIAAGEFPRPVRISAGRVAFRESDVRAWMQGREAVPA